MVDVPGWWDVCGMRRDWASVVDGGWRRWTEVGRLTHMGRGW